MSKKQVNLENVQLSVVFSKYDKYISNSEDRDTLIGYSVLEGILAHTHKSNAPEEQKFEEVKTIYSVLQSNLKQYDKKNIHLFNIIKDINKKIEDIINEDREIHSEIINASVLIQLNNKKPKTDYIKNLGTKLYDLSRNRLKGNRNILMHDYEIIKQTYR